MVNVSGPLIVVTEDAAQVSEVTVSALHTRPHGGGLLLDQQSPAQLNASKVLSFSAVPGPIVITLMQGGRPLRHVKGIVPDKASATLAEVVRAAGLADAGTLSQLEALALEVAAEAARVGTAVQVGAWADQASGAASDAADAADAASESASTAATAASSVPGRVATEITTQLPTKIDQLVPPKVAEVIGGDTVVRDAAAAAAADVVPTAVDEAIGTRLDGKSDKGHSHLSSGITDASDGFVGFIAQANRVLKLNASGKLTVSSGNITEGADVANKTYVDTETGKKAPISHKHTSDDITYASAGQVGWAAQANRVLKLTDQGKLFLSTGAITEGTDATNKNYVDAGDASTLKTAKEYTDQVSSAGDPRLADAALHHDIRVQEALIAAGGQRKVTNTAVALVFDHGTNNFDQIILPMLRARGIPSTIALNSRMYDPASQRYHHDDETTWDTIRGWAISHGVEIANHGATHNHRTTVDTYYDEVVNGLRELQTNLPGVQIDSWVQSAGTMGDYGTGTVLDRFADSPAGKLIYKHHSGIVTGRYPRQWPLTGWPRLAMPRFWVDTSSGEANARAAITDTPDGHGILISHHPELLNGTDYVDTAGLEAFFDFLVEQRDSGRITLMTLRQLSFARAA